MLELFTHIMQFARHTVLAPVEGSDIGRCKTERDSHLVKVAMHFLGCVCADHSGRDLRRDMMARPPSHSVGRSPSCESMIHKMRRMRPNVCILTCCLGRYRLLRPSSLAKKSTSSLKGSPAWLRVWARPSRPSPAASTCMGIAL